MKFVKELPPRGNENRFGPREKTTELLAELRANPGCWAEIARWPAGPASSNRARSRGHLFSRKHLGIEYACRTVDGELVLFYRAVSE